MILTLVVLAGVTACAWFVTRRSVDELARRAAVSATNHRGLRIAATGGIALVLGVFVAAALAQLLLIALGDGFSEDGILIMASVQILVVPAAGFALIGLYDDVAGSSDERGWADHTKALREGRATPGAVKLVGGAVLGLVVAPGSFVFAPAFVSLGPYGGVTKTDVILDAVTGGLVIALSANLLNAFDLRPLRAIKAAGVWLAILAVFAVVAPTSLPLGPGLVLAAALAGLWTAERRERIMLGDSGSNALGAMLGTLLVVAESAEGPAGPGLGRWLIVAILVGLTVVANRPGFDSIIRRVGPLRAFDAWARQPDPVREDPAE